jgi:osomolarity two-component system, phosphorelay intermediate protein YPD1
LEYVGLITALLPISSTQKNLDELSGLGHFLKGSSATLGFNKIRDSCQIIQQYGHQLTVDGAPEPDKEVCLKRIGGAIKSVKVDTAELKKSMAKFFGQSD